MKHSFAGAAALSLLLGASPAVLAAEPADPGMWQAVDRILGRVGRVSPGEVHKYGWPRSDLRVSVGGVTLEPALALGAWAGFATAGGEGQVMAMGAPPARPPRALPSTSCKLCWAARAPWRAVFCSSPCRGPGRSKKTGWRCPRVWEWPRR